MSHLGAFGRINSHLKAAIKNHPGAAIKNKELETYVAVCEIEHPSVHGEGDTLSLKFIKKADGKKYTISIDPSANGTLQKDIAFINQTHNDAMA